MQKHFLWAAFSIACALSTSACTEVRSCELGEPGCKGGAPIDGACDFNLVVVGGKCAEPSGDSGGGNNGSDGGGSNGDDAGGNNGTPLECVSCDPGELCTTDTMSCVDFCEVPEVLPGSVKPPDWIKCGGELLDMMGTRYDPTFDESCKARCELFCRQQEQYCDKGCDAGFCDDQGVLDACHAACDSKPDPKACVRGLCNDRRAASCPSEPNFCLDGGDADCEEVTCLNTCGFPFDGACDDGDIFNAQFIECEWGTDCADCGPRRGKDESRRLPQGGLCNFNAACDGYSKVYARNEAFCVTVEPGSKIFRCMLDCSSEGEQCPEGYECTALSKDGKPLEDEAGTVGRFCKPKQSCN